MEGFEWWIKSYPLSSEEKALMYPEKRISEYEDEICDVDTFYELKSRIFNKILHSENIKDYTLSFEKCATDLITTLFEKYVDDDTLVITSSSEHNNVKKLTARCKNFVEIHNFSVATQKLHKFKKAFVYFIATQISNGEITPQSFFIDLKAKLKALNIDAVFVLDAVQEMFIYPRDYSLFDYIIGTAHSLAIGCDLGIILGKNDTLGKLIINKGNMFDKILDVYTSRLYKISLLKILLTEHFSYLNKSKHFKILPNTNSNFFIIHTKENCFTQEMYDLLYKYHIRIEGIGTENKYIRFRAQHFIAEPEKLIPGIHRVDMLLESLSNELQ